MRVADLTLDQIQSVYSGRDGRCCCGCSGTHRYASAHVESASKNRGYTVTPDEVNDRQVAKVFRIVKENVEKAETFDVDYDYDCVSVVLGTRLYILYFVEPVKRFEDESAWASMKM